MEVTGLHLEVGALGSRHGSRLWRDLPRRLTTQPSGVLAGERAEDHLWV